MLLYRFPDLLSKEWKVVSKEEARLSPYYGFRGWLLLFYISILFVVVSDLLQAVTVPNPRFAYGGGVGVTRAVLLSIAAVNLPFLILAPMKHRLMPRLGIAGTWITVVIFAATIDMPGQIDGVILRVAFVVAFAALMTWYILSSRRVNVTYLNRVPLGSLNS